MRKAIIAAVLVASSQFAGAAGGAWDGIYSCGISLQGAFYNQYVTVNGQTDGRAIYASAAVSQFTPFYGYGIGIVNGALFTGSTMLGLPFTATRTADGFSVSIQIASA